MVQIVNYPELVFALSFVLLVISGWIGKRIGHRRRMEGAAVEDFRLTQGATLTLLALIIGFTFSMALSRYDQRKNYEEEEANAIGTEYVRVGLMPPADAARTRSLLRGYLDQRIQYYRAGRGTGREQIRQTNAQTAQLQSALWSSVQAYAAGGRPPSTLWWSPA